MRGEFVDLDGARVYYYAAGTRGAGEPIVLIHGFPTAGHLWTETVPHLPSGHRVVVLDLLGFGRSDRPGTHEITIGAHAARTVALLDALGIDHACVVGHDVGGAVALRMALDAPERVSRLALVSTAAFDGWPTRDVRLARAAAPVTRHLPAAMVAQIVRADLLRGFVHPERAALVVDRYLRPFLDEAGRDVLFRHLVALDPRDTAAIASRLPDVVQPTTIVWGRRDPFLPVVLAHRLAGAIPGAALDVVDEGAHFLPEDCPRRVGDAVTALFSRS